MLHIKMHLMIYNIFKGNWWYLSRSIYFVHLSCIDWLVFAASRVDLVRSYENGKWGMNPLRQHRSFGGANTITATLEIRCVFLPGALQGDPAADIENENEKFDS